MRPRVYGPRSLAVAEVRAGTGMRAGSEQQQRSEGAAVERHFDDAAIVDELGDVGVLRFEQRRAAGDFDGLLDIAYRE